MAVGDMIGYWKYFEPSDYGIEMDGQEKIKWGRMPVFPIAQSLDMKPVKLTPLGFQDGKNHRTALHPIYNGYTFVDADPSFAAHRKLQPVLRPLFTTSFLIDDFLADETFFGAEQVLLLSASSKTALGTAYCLKQRGNIKVTALSMIILKKILSIIAWSGNPIGMGRRQRRQPSERPLPCSLRLIVLNFA